MKIFITLVFSFCIFARPQNIDVIFLSPTKAVKETFFNTALKVMSVAQNSKCIPMADGCFHPQLGFIEDEQEAKDKQAPPVELKTFNALETNLIDCKEGNFFDIFCGKATALEVNKKVNYEVWIDTSSSLRNFDWNEDPGRCARRSFVERLSKNCDLEIKTFDTSIKQMGSLDGLCVTYGLNDQDRMIKWIEASVAKHLIIVTDIDEASTKVRDYLFNAGAKLHGADYGDYNGEKLLEFSQSFESACQKKKN